MPEDPPPCDRWCPFLACDGCPYQRVNPAAAEADSDTKRCDNRTNVRENRTGNDERPTASTADRSEHPDSTQPKARAYLS